MNSTDSDYPWTDSEGNVQSVEINNIKFINGVLRNSDVITINSKSKFYRSYGSGFIDFTQCS